MNWLRKLLGVPPPLPLEEETIPENMWIIAGLGNPGSRYDETAHNLGFDVLKKLANRHNLRWTAARQGKAEAAKGEIAGQDIALLAPTTFMNLSGEAIGPYSRYYKVTPAHVLVISDDVALPWGRLRIRAGGSAGGHNGLKSIIQHLSTDQFPRLRIGCAPENWKGDLAAYVLAKLRGEALELADHMAEIAADAVEDILKRGLEKTQTKYNRYDAMKTD